MLQWHPRLIALLATVALLVAAVGGWLDEPASWSW